MSSLLSIEERLMDAIQSGEIGKLAAARLVRQIHSEELWRDGGFKSFSAYLPTLLERTAAVGWGAARTIKQYIKLWAVCREQMELDEADIIRGVSHLNELLRVASIGKKFILNDDSEKPGELGAEQFGAVVDAIVDMLNGVAVEAESYAGKTFKELTGEFAVIPSGGWTLEDTKRVIAKIKGETDDEDKVKITRQWDVVVPGEDVVGLIRLNFFRGEELLYYKEFVDEAGEPDFVDREVFDQMVGKDAVVPVERAGE
jgi:hypothetical protein